MLNDQTIREVWRRVASGEDQRGSFLTNVARAVIHADQVNFIRLRPIAVELIEAYNLLFNDELAALLRRAIPNDKRFDTIAGFTYVADAGEPFNLFAIRTNGLGLNVIASYATEAELLKVCPTANPFPPSQPKADHDEQSPEGRTTD